MSQSPWSEERVAVLTRLWLDGKSSTEIARLFKMTRNMVIGKVSRLGLARSPECAMASQVQSMIRQRPAKPKGAPRRLPPMRVSVAQITDTTHAKPFLERRRYECAWIVAGEGCEALCCALPVCDRGRLFDWCKVHSEIGLVKPKRTWQDREREPAPRRAA